MNNLSNFVERLSELIFDTETNATNLSLELGFANATISHYLTGRYLPAVENVVKLADYFNCTTDYLLGITDENHVCKFKLCPPFGERLLYVCEYYHVSRYQLRKMTGISETVMRYWVKGKTNPSIENVVKIAKTLNCSVDFVLGRES